MKNIEFNINLSAIEGIIRLQHNSRYASGAVYCSNAEELIKEINYLCGTGSFLIYSKSKIQPNGTPECRYGGKLTYFQDACKMQAIEEAFKLAKATFNNFNYTLTDWVNEFREWED